MKRKQRFVSDGTPIIDEPLFSFRRMVGATGIWCYFAIERIWYPGYGYWYVLRYWRRPYAEHQAKQKKAKI